MRRAALLLTIAGVVLLPATAARADRVALAGDRLVSLGVTVDGIAVDVGPPGGATTAVDTLEFDPGGFQAVDASTERVAVYASTNEDADPPENATWVGPLSGPLTLVRRCSGVSSGGVRPAVSGATVVTADGCSPRRLRLDVAGAVRTVEATANVVDVRAAVGLAGWRTETEMVVADAASGIVQQRLPIRPAERVLDWHLQADGTVRYSLLPESGDLCRQTFRESVVGAPGPRPLTHLRGCGTRFVVAGGQVVRVLPGLAEDRLAATPASSDGPTAVLSRLGSDVEAGLVLDADGSRVLFARSACLDADLEVVDLTAPPALPLAVPSCPVRVPQRAARVDRRSGFLRLVLSCPRGCTGAQFGTRITAPRWLRSAPALGGWVRTSSRAPQPLGGPAFLLSAAQQRRIRRNGGVTATFRLVDTYGRVTTARRRVVVAK